VRLEARAAAAADLNEAVALIEAAAIEAAGERGGKLFVARARSGAPLADRLQQRVSDESSVFALGTLDGVAVGLALGRLAEPHSSGRVATIEAIYVDPEARGVGVGEELLAFVTTWALERGVTGLDVPVLPGVREAKNFFEASGYVARYLVMHRRLTAE
jgi:GNAT superfamily N-acetyltransferase